MRAAGAVLEIAGLALARGERALVRNLACRLEGGAFLALIGPNGSGKTTLLRAIAGLVRPTAGRIALTIEGDILDGPERGERLHLLGHRDGLKGPLDAAAHLNFWRGALGGAQGFAPAEALRRVGLSGLGGLPTRAFSAGQGRRLALARLLIAPRPLWLLDEPAAALDAAGKTLVADLIAAHCAAGGLVVAALHEPLPRPADDTLDLAAFAPALAEA